MAPSPTDVGYVLRRGLAVTLVIAAICAAVALLAGGGGDQEYSSSATVLVSVPAPPAPSAPAPRAERPPADTTDRDGDGVTFAPNARDERPKTRQGEGGGASDASRSQARSRAIPGKRLQALAARVSGAGVEGRVRDERTIEVEATGASVSEAENGAGAAADALVRRASKLRLGTPPARVNASIADGPSPASETNDSDVLGNLGTGLLIGLPLGIAVAALLHLLSLGEARRAREQAARAGEAARQA